MSPVCCEQGSMRETVVFPYATIFHTVFVIKVLACNAGCAAESQLLSFYSAQLRSHGGILEVKAHRYTFRRLHSFFSTRIMY